MSIGYNIRKLRESKGLSQSELGEIAGVSDKAVSTWENNIKTPRMGAIQKIADYFGISKSDIIEDKSQLKSAAPFAAFGKHGSDFTQDEINQINNFIEFVKKQRNKE